LLEFGDGESTDEVAVLQGLHSGFLHGLPEHLGVRLRDQFRGRIVAVRDAFKQVVDSENLDDSKAVSDVCIRQKPKFDSAGVDGLEELP
jgi:hypothetical protein